MFIPGRGITGKVSDVTWFEHEMVLAKLVSIPKSVSFEVLKESQLVAIETVFLDWSNEP